MKGRMKKTFTALLAATVLVGGMPVNMQANVIAETEKTESASEKVNEKYADTEENALVFGGYQVRFALLDTARSVWQKITD